VAFKVDIHHAKESKQIYCILLLGRWIIGKEEKSGREGGK